jgi:hypothetical protein
MDQKSCWQLLKGYTSYNNTDHPSTQVLWKLDNLFLRELEKHFYAKHIFFFKSSYAMVEP